MADTGLSAVRIELDRAELGFVWQRSSLPTLPAALSALTVRDHGWPAATGPAGRLRSRGLLGPRGELNPELRQVLGVLTSSPFELELRHTDGHCHGVRAAATVRGGVVVIGMVSGDRVVLRRLPGTWAEDATGAALVGLLPRTRPANGVAVSLPAAEVDRAMLASMERGQDVDEGLVEGLTARGVAPVDAAMFAGLTSSKRLRSAMFGVTVRDRHGVRHRSNRTFTVLDTDRGRALTCTHGDYLMATPADDRTLTKALAELRASELARG
ncbi:MAG TPA: ESX secretion-associated protein EspG [Pseudonocardiaceae bacterium]|nr:ESX secretion-associated protein EspG [Pseudonocardiaceae bacterium]